MKGTARYFLSLMLLLSCAFTEGQSLGKVSPVTLKSGDLSDSISFVLTTLDNNLYKHKPQKYASAIQIIDADAPWPPRWYALHPSDTTVENKPTMLLMLNASYENDHFLFLTVAQASDGKNLPAVITCDRSMTPTDSFFAYRKLMDSHDYVSSPAGEMMYFAIYDTVVDLRQAYGDPAESAMHMIYQTIEIADKSGKSVFSWSPLTALGFDAIYKPYRYTQGVRANHTQFDWSHGNSIHYDYDGNILYSFKHIGIGKISRSDGHVIWHIDRNKQKVNERSDSLPIFLQHDLQAVRAPNGDISYTIWSNGDILHPFCKGYQFTVHQEGNGEPIVKLIKTMTPTERIPNTGGGGNMDVNAAGDYLLNYGLYPQDTTLAARTLFEYKAATDSKATLYETSPTIFSFRVHRLAGWRPERPVITQMGKQLSTHIKAKAPHWYRLSGPGLKTVTYLGKSNSYTPSEDGYYCVAARLGIGWTVSKAFHFTKK